MNYSHMKKFLLIVLISSFFQTLIYSQEKEKEFIKLYKTGDYKNSLIKINKDLKSEYTNRIDYKKIPTSFITIKNIEKDINLIKIFRERKEKGYFIEDNEKLFTLHLYAARCLFKQKKYNYSKNHYFQSLRFKKLENKKDDIIFYEISQVNKSENHFNSYVNALETAYTLNPDNSEYSRELGLALYRTNKKKKSIFHLERYVNSSPDLKNVEILLKLGNLYEDIGRYLDTEKYYKMYLKKNPDNPQIQFALGYISFKKTGNYPLALSSFNKSIEKLPKADIYRRSKAYEYRADMFYSDLNHQMAIQNYLETIKYQQNVLQNIDKIKKKSSRLGKRISKLKASLISN